MTPSRNRLSLALAIGLTLITTPAVKSAQIVYLPFDSPAVIDCAPAAPNPSVTLSGEARVQTSAGFSKVGGSYTFTARAVDNEEEITLSSPVTITVAAGGVTDLTSIQVEGTGSQFVTFGTTFPPGAVQAGQQPILTDSAGVPLAFYQTQVRATHADGSGRHAVFHGFVSGGTVYRIRTGEPLAGASLTVADFLAAVPGDLAKCTFSRGVTGVASLRDLLTNPGNRAIGGLQIIESGAKVLELIVAQNFNTHLRVNFHVRWYGGNVYWVDPFFELSYADLPNQNSLNYDVAIEVAGVAAGTRTMAPHFNHTMWHQKQEGFWSSGGTLYVKHNTRYIIDSGAVPNYGLTKPSESFIRAQRQITEPMDNGDYRDHMDGAGFDQTLAILPGWEANYLKSDGDSRLYKQVLANADGGGAYNFMLLNSTTGNHMTEQQFPNASWNQEIGFGSGAFSGLNQYADSSVNSHIPSVGYLPYLLTGNQFHLRLMHGWVTFENLWNSVHFNATFNDLVFRKPYENSLRGIGWQVRSNAQAAYVTPDVHPMKAYFKHWMAGTGDLLNSQYGPGGTRRNKIGGMFMAEGTDNYRIFFHMFAHQSFAYAALDLGFTEFLEPARYASILMAGLAGSTGEFPFEAFPRAGMKIGPTGAGVPSESAVFYSSFAEIRTQLGLPEGDSGSRKFAEALIGIDGGYSGLRNEWLRQGDPTSYFANVLPCMSYLERLGIDGGYACWYRTTLCQKQPDFSNEGEYDIRPRKIKRPAYIRNAPKMSWVQIPDTLLSTATPNPYPPPGDASARIVAWGGLAVKTLGSEIRFCASGGHGDSSSNDVAVLRLNAEAPGWKVEFDPTLNVRPNTAYYADGKPVSRHVYYDQQFHDGLNRQILHGATFVYSNASSFNTVTAYSPSARDYLPAATYPDSPGAAGVAAKNKNWASEHIWFLTANGNSFLRRFDPASGHTSGGVNTSDYGEIYKAASIDPIRGRMLTSRDYSIGNPTGVHTPWRWYDLDTGTKTTLDGAKHPGAVLSPALRANLDSDQGSLEWDTRGNRHLFYRSGATVFAIDPETFVATPLPISGTPPPNSAPNGLFSRARYVPELDIFVVIPNYDSNVYFFKFHDEPR